MLSPFGLPPGRHAVTQKYFCMGSGIWQTWQKPRGVTFHYFILIGSGGGGGSGFTRPAGDDGGGGGGGASAAFGELLIPTIALPDILYFLVAEGGIGGDSAGAGSNGAAGEVSYIAYQPNTAAQTLIMKSGNSAAGAGTRGTGTGNGAGGSGPTAAGQLTLSTMGIWSGTGGVAGVTGGARTGGAGSNVPAWSANVFTGGAGGAGSTGTDFDGGSVRPAATANMVFLQRSSSEFLARGGVAGGDVNGGGGLQLWEPLLGTGGGGGASNDAGTAGNGGRGAIGCGGAGGGAGTVGGWGGQGGHGLIMVVSW